jgi:MFS family permease
MLSARNPPPHRKAQSVPGKPLNSFSHAWSALRYRNFRLFFCGQTISLLGTWMTRLATAWLVYRLTHSAFLLGIVGFASLIPAFLLAPFAGVWIERMDRRKLIVCTQAVAAVQSLAMAALTLTHRITIAEVIALSALQGIVDGFDLPARQSFLIQMVDDKSDLANAIAINSSMNNGARLVGPAIAGLVVAGFGEGWCFLIDGLSYLPVIASLLAMRLQPHAAAQGKATMLHQMREGWDFVRTFPPIRTILILFALVSLMGYPFSTLLPIFAGQVLHGGAHTLGWLTSASGIGALLSGISLTLRKSPAKFIRIIAVATALFGVSLIFFGLSHQLWLSLLLMFFAGFGMLQTASASNTVIQTLVPEDKRARVMGFYTMAFVGSAPFGSLLAGSLAHWIGAPFTVVLTGACVVAGSLWFALQLPGLHRIIDPIYREKGILPPADALQHAK